MSNLRDFERSSCAVTAPESASSVATLAAVQDPAGRNSSTSPDAVAVSCGAVAKIRLPHQVEYVLLDLGAAFGLTCVKKGRDRSRRLTQINCSAVARRRVPVGLCSKGKPCSTPAS